MLTGEQDGYITCRSLWPHAHEARATHTMQMVKTYINHHQLNCRFSRQLEMVSAFAELCMFHHRIHRLRQHALSCYSTSLMLPCYHVPTSDPLLSVKGSFLQTHLQPLMTTRIGLPMNPAVFVCRVRNTSGHAATSIWLRCNTTRQGAVSVCAVCNAPQQLVAAPHGLSLQSEEIALHRHVHK